MENRQFVLILLYSFLLTVSYGIEQIRQCKCNQQKLCFERMKDEIAECLDQCVDRAGLQKLINSTSTFAPCMEMRKNQIFTFFDCIQRESIRQESCFSGIGEQKAEYNDFEGILLKYIQPWVERIHQNLEDISMGLQIPFIKNAMYIDKCSRKCGIQKLRNLYCFNGQKCALKIKNLEVKKILNECIAQIDLNQHFLQVCKCFNQNGENDILAFCDKIQWAQIAEHF